MKLTSDDLFQLIKSMTKTEKRYFKIDALKRGRNMHYLGLFDAIDKQSKKKDKYDEKELLAQFDNKKNFSVAKAYLYKKILRVMREFYVENTSTDESVNEMVSNIKYLSKRSLFKQAKKLLVKAYQYVDRYEQFLDKIILIKLERFLISYPVFKESQQDTYRRLYRLESSCISYIKQISEYENLANEIYLQSINFGKGNTSKLIDKLHELNNHLLLQNENLATLYHTKRSYYHAKSMYYAAIKDYKKSFLYQKKRFELYDEYPQFIPYKVFNYIAALHNLLLSCVGVGNQQDFEHYLKIMRAIKSKEKGVKSAVFNSSYHMEIKMYLKTKQFDKLLKLVPDVKKGLATYSGVLGTVGEQNIFFGLSCLFFQLKEYHQATGWINKLLDYDQNNQHPNIQSSAKIMQLFIYYEMGYIDSLPYLLRSSQRYFSKKGKMLDIEKEAISTIKLFLKCNDKEEEKEIYTNFKKAVTNSKDLALKELMGQMGFVF
ncbi:MAG: hypothetical protein J5I47_12320 [Vicingus serpentipes]|nr:hypothetical protein [Vicingus serpentipes]